MKILAILRAERFSPNSVEKDRAIMTAVVSRLQEKGHEVSTVSEEQEGCGLSCGNGNTSESTTPDVVLTMGRLPQTLERLQSLKGVRIINTPEGVRNCARSTLTAIMAENGTPVAPSKGDHGYWLKRGDAAAQSKGDVVYAENEKVLKKEIEGFEQRGIKDYVVTAHVQGDLVKFYGVVPGFFRYFYPTDDGVSKFGDEQRNGQARHYEFSAIDLQQVSERLAAAVGISVYGGDCIVGADGRFCIIDFNDWPSFSRCREEAAEAIARLITKND